MSAAATAAGYLYACGRIGKKNKPLDTAEQLPERAAPVAQKPAPTVTYRKRRS